MHEARHRTVARAWWVRPKAAALVAVAVTGLAVAVGIQGRGDVASADTHALNPARFGRAAFADNFTGDQDGLDLSKWRLLRDDGGPATGGARVSDGELQVSRLLRTRQSFTDAFGHAEARIKVRRENGVWRAFSVLDQNGRVPQGTLETIDGGIDPTSGRNFHTYAIDWSPEAVVWSVDGKPSLRLVRQDKGGPLTLVLNLATDGRSASRMTVDFVQVFTNSSEPPTADPTSPPASGDPAPSGSPSDSPSASPSESPSASPSGQPTPPEEPSPTSPAPTTTAPPAPTTAPTTSAPPPAVAEWKPFTAYKAGDLVKFKKVTYRVLEAHTSLPGWEPTKLPNLFAKVS
ncbi:carbohydrate-binding protein [Actinoplanes sp. CA-030573]|uniref:carbohydrate-binding protein n=1 Tax=Actinoplanes sp. CA-030573 TaxID=3239898 RepID=UPI003D919A50